MTELEKVNHANRILNQINILFLEGSFRGDKYKVIGECLEFVQALHKETKAKMEELTPKEKEMTDEEANEICPIIEITNE